MDILFSLEFWTPYGEAAKTAVGFFWKSGWAFVLGYFISAMSATKATILQLTFDTLST